MSKIGEALKFGILFNVIRDVANFFIGVIIARYIKIDEFGEYAVCHGLLVIINGFGANTLYQSILRDGHDWSYFKMGLKLNIAVVLTLIISFVLVEADIIYFIALAPVPLVEACSSYFLKTVEGQLDFRSYRTYNIYSQLIVSVFSAIAVFYFKNGLVALVFQPLLFCIPGFIFFWTRFKRMQHSKTRKLNMDLFSANILQMLFQNIKYPLDNFVITYLYGSVLLGNYNRMQGFHNQVIQKLPNTLNDSVQSILYKRGVRAKKYFLYMVLVISIFFTADFIIGENIFNYLYDKKWRVSLTFFCPLLYLSTMGCILKIITFLISTQSPKRAGFLSIYQTVGVVLVAGISVGLKLKIGDYLLLQICVTGILLILALCQSKRLSE